jgi:hypothetical protein
MPDKLWKQHERHIAKRFGSARTGPQGKEGPDVITEWLCIEAKERDQLPAWLDDAIQQITACTPQDKLPVVILHGKGRRHDNDLVILRLKDFEDWFGGEKHGEMEIRQ